MVSAVREMMTMCAADDLFSRIYSEPRETSRQFARPQSSQQIGALKQIRIAMKYIGKTGKGDRGSLWVRPEQRGLAMKLEVLS